MTTNATRKDQAAKEARRVAKWTDADLAVYAGYWATMAKPGTAAARTLAAVLTEIENRKDTTS